jgi:hypothetical protein
MPSIRRMPQPSSEKVSEILNSRQEKARVRQLGGVSAKLRLSQLMRDSKHVAHSAAGASKNPAHKFKEAGETVVERYVKPRLEGEESRESYKLKLKTAGALAPNGQSPAFRLSNEFADGKSVLAKKLEENLKKMAMERHKAELLSGSSQGVKERKLMSVIELLKGSGRNAHVQTLLG